jgi:hypothetical protein
VAASALAVAVAALADAFGVTALGVTAVAALGAVLGGAPLEVVAAFGGAVLGAGRTGSRSRKGSGCVGSSKSDRTALRTLSAASSSTPERSETDRRVQGPPSGREKKRPERANQMPTRVLGARTTLPATARRAPWSVISHATSTASRCSASGPSCRMSSVSG